MRRQGLNVSISGLKRLIRELEEETRLNSELVGLKMPQNKKWLVSIINRSDVMSDTWVIEEAKK